MFYVNMVSGAKSSCNILIYQQFIYKGNIMNSRLSQKKQAIILSLFIILAAQINIDVFTNYFRVSMGILLFPIYILLFQEIPMIPVTLISGTGVLLSRVIISGLTEGFTLYSFIHYFPELIFYLVYGFASYFYFRRNEYKLQGKFCYLFLFLIDYTANAAELLCRMQTESFSFRLHFNILFIAALRTLILWALISGLGQYKFALLNHEHANRYQRLILLISKLNGEVIWMKKNTALIEETMARSYKLFSQMQEQHVDSELSQNALAVAKDIHEIKKEYMLILRGISEALDLNLQDGEMTLADILTVLENTLSLAAQQQNKQLTFHTQYSNNILTDKHYFLLSVFRNLFTNAIEANEDGNITLRFEQTETDSDYLFSITDNGPGIPPENLGQIFTPGFSTKINFTTGEINRGLGLNLVKDMIETQFSGEIHAESRPKHTTFFIRIPKAELEVS